MVICEEIIRVVILVEEALAEPVPEPGKIAIVILSLCLNLTQCTLDALLLG